MASEFEKNVQRIMDGLRVHPSGEVWQRVEERIRENKRRRRILFVIVFSLTGLTLTGYGIFHFQGRPGLKPATSLSTTHKPEGVPQTSPGPTGTDQDETIKNASPNTETVKTTRSESTIAFDKTSGGNMGINKRRHQSNIKKTSSQRATKSLPGISSTKKRSTQVETTQIANSKTTLPNDQSISSDSPHTMVDPVEARISKDDINDSTAGRTPEKLTEVKKTAAKYQSKWKWGLNVSLGASTITQDPFSFKGASYADANALTSPASSTGSGVSHSPSSNKPAFAFKAGFHLKNGISPRSSLSAGLTYSYLADKIKIGQGSLNSQQSASSRSAYYSATPQTSYTEHFHFIELPVMYNWRMTKNTDHYFSLGGGVSASYLASTNALIYDTAQHGIYYRDNSLFTRMHFNLIAGTAYNVFTKNNLELAIGPQFSFDLSKFIDSDVDKRKYFLYVGVDTRIFFETRKSK